MKKLALALFVMCCVSGCDTAKTARDVIATDYGYIVTAQQQQLVACRQDSTQSKCITINKAIDIHKLAQDSLNAYCSGPRADGPDYQHGGDCSPVKSAEAGLRVAVDNLQTIVVDIKEIVR